MEESAIDATDLRLLELLQDDASLTNQALAERAHLSPPTCLRRVKRLRERGLIAREVALLDADRLAPLLGHGLTALVEVSLERQDDRLCLCVTDNGAGGPVIPGVGLESLRSRASEIGGTLVIESAHPTGTRLSITIPDGGVP